MSSGQAPTSQASGSAAATGSGQSSGQSAATTSAEPACGALSAQEAALQAAQQLPPPFEDPSQADITWDPSYPELSGYDACASLAWIVMPIQGGTGSSPYAIALYHHGQYLGSATEKSYGFAPTVTRRDDATIQVVYHWPKDNESNAEASGTSTAQFHYDEASGSVQMSGDVPPS